MKYVLNEDDVKVYVKYVLNEIDAQSIIPRFRGKGHVYETTISGCGFCFCRSTVRNMIPLLGSQFHP